MRKADLSFFITPRCRTVVRSTPRGSNFVFVGGRGAPHSNARTRPANVSEKFETDDAVEGPKPSHVRCETTMSPDGDTATSGYGSSVGFDVANTANHGSISMLLSVHPPAPRLRYGGSCFVWLMWMSPFIRVHSSWFIKSSPSNSEYWWNTALSSVMTSTGRNTGSVSDVYEKCVAAPGIHVTPSLLTSTVTGARRYARTAYRDRIWPLTFGSGASGCSSNAGMMRIDMLRDLSGGGITLTRLRATCTASTSTVPKRTRRTGSFGRSMPKRSPTASSSSFSSSSKANGSYPSSSWDSPAMARPRL
eukprot:PhM_4_TR18047/c0_g1_i3/m.97364